MMKEIITFITTNDLTNLLSVCLVSLSLSCMIAVILLIRKNIQDAMKTPSVFLEIVPPWNNQQSILATEQLFTTLHSLSKQISFGDRFLGRKKTYALELVSTKEEGIRYIIKTPVEDVPILKKNLISFLPNVQIQEIQDYLPDTYNKATKTVEFTLSRHFSIPLKHQSSLAQYDTIAYMSGQMTKLEPDEYISLQLIITPLQGKQAREIQSIKKTLQEGIDITQHLKNATMPDFIHVLRFPVSICLFVLLTPIQLIKFTLNKQEPDPLPFWLLFGNYSKKYKELSPQKQYLHDIISEKIHKELFEVTIRITISQTNPARLKERITGIKSSFSMFHHEKGQSLIMKYSKVLLGITNLQRYLFMKDKYRLLSLTQNAVLSIPELSNIYHFPYFPTTHTEDVVKNLSKELPAPLALKQMNRESDVVFARNMYGNTITPIGLTLEERRRHVYILGATGTGKSTMLLSMITQDLHNNKGVCVIDPHGELAESALACVPEERKDDVIYFNPDDLAYPIGINLLELTPNLSEEDSLREREFIAESVVSLFRKVFSDAWAAHPHRIEYILRNTIHTAFTTENPTFFTIYDLLNDPVFRKDVINKLTDENLKNFWKFEFSKAGDYQQVKMVSPVTAKIGRFLFSPSAKRILEQKKSTINVDRIMDEGKILICNLSKGILGEDTSEVLGILLLNKIQLAALKRARQETQERKDFYLYVDEFQNFATPSFIQMLSESRKYKLHLTLAEQTTSQIANQNLVNIILANVGSIVCFRTANPEDEKLILPQFTPYVEPGEIQNLPAFHFYMKISAIKAQEPFSGETILTEIQKDQAKIQRIIEASRNNYAIVYKEQQEKEAQERVEKTKKKTTRKQEQIKKNDNFLEDAMI